MRLRRIFQVDFLGSGELGYRAKKVEKNLVRQCGKNACKVSMLDI